jgi:hypothetical protein
MAQAAEQADDEAEVPPVEDDDDEIVTAQVVSAALGTTGPREAIREFALSNPGSCQRVLRRRAGGGTRGLDELQALQEAIAGRGPVLERQNTRSGVLLEQGFGKPEPAPLEPDEQLHAQYALYLEKLTDERLEMTVPLDERQRKLVNEYPPRVQYVFLDADFDEVEGLARKHGWTLNAEDMERLRALCPPSVFARST